MSVTEATKKAADQMFDPTRGNVFFQRGYTVMNAHILTKDHHYEKDGGRAAMDLYISREHEKEEFCLRLNKDRLFRKQEGSKWTETRMEVHQDIPVATLEQAMSLAEEFFAQGPLEQE